MSEQYYENHKFEGLTLENELLERYEFIDCTFVGCTVEHCKLLNCVFSDCKFEKCSVANIEVKDSRMVFSEFVSCNLVGIDWLTLLPDGKFAIPISKLQSCHLKYNTFTEVKFNKFDFSGTEIVRSMFAKCELGGSNFRRCKLNETEFFQCDIRKADFREASGYQIDIMTNKMKAAKFSYPDAICLLDGLELEIE